MNDKHWLDSKDFFKRGFLSILRETGILRNLQVVPCFTGKMQTEAGPYAKFLGFDKVLVDEEYCGNEDSGRRRAYWKNAQPSIDDLLIDVDCGISIRKRDPEHISVEEVCDLCQPYTQRIIIVYQAGFNWIKSETHAQSIICEIGKRGVQAFMYYGANPSLVFVSGDAKRLGVLQSYFQDKLRIPARTRRGEPSDRKGGFILS